MSPGKLDLLSCVCLPAWSLSTFPARLSLLSLRTSAGSTASPGHCDPKLTPFLRWLAPSSTLGLNVFASQCVGCHNETRVCFTVSTWEGVLFVFLFCLLFRT